MSRGGVKFDAPDSHQAMVRGVSAFERPFLNEDLRGTKTTSFRSATVTVSGDRTTDFQPA